MAEKKKYEYKAPEGYDNPKSKKKKEVTDRLESVLKNFRIAHDYVDTGYFDTWDKCWKLYNNKRVEAGYVGVADGFVPHTKTIVDSILANIASGRPKFEFHPRHIGQEEDTETLNALMDYYWDQNPMTTVVTNWMKDMIVLGTGILHCTWDAEKDCPTAKNIPLKDFFFDPTGTDYHSLSYAGFRYLAKKSDLENEMVVNPDFNDEEEEDDKKNPRLVKRFKNLDQVTGGGSGSDKMDKEDKDMFLGSTLGKKASQDQVEVIYYVDKERLIQVANRSVVIEDVETPFKRDEQEIESFDDEGFAVTFTLPEVKPFLPFAPLRNYVDSSLFMATGDVQAIMERQETLNDTDNQQTDNFSYVNTAIFALDPSYADQVEEFDWIPGSIFTVPPAALEQIRTQPLGGEAEQKIARIKDEMQRVTAADEVIQGAAQQKSRTTAFEIEQQLTQAGTRFGLKLQGLEGEGYKIFASIWFKLTQIHVTQEQAVRVIGDKGVEWKTYNPGEYLGDYDPKVLLDVNRKAIKEEEKRDALEFFQASAEMPFVNLPELWKKMAKKVYELEDDQVERLIMQEQPEPQMDPAMEEQMMQEQMAQDPMAQDPMMDPGMIDPMQDQVQQTMGDVI